MTKNDFNPGIGKRIFALIACSLAGLVGGGLGSIFAWVWGVYGQAGLLGQNEPGFLGPILSGGWILGIFGLTPGLTIGFIYGITNNYKVWVTVVLVVLFTCYAVEIAYGYSRNIPACFFYVGAPSFIVLGSAFASSRLKIRLGLMPPKQAQGFDEADDELFDGRKGI